MRCELVRATYIWNIGENTFEELPIESWDGNWSPDGTLMAWGIASGEGSSSDIYLTDTNGNNPINLTDDASSVDLNPRWSPDGTQIGFASQAGGMTQLKVMNADGSSQATLVNCNFPSCSIDAGSPEGKEIAYWDGGEIWTVNTDGRYRIRVAPPEDSSVTQISWGFQGSSSVWQPISAVAVPGFSSLGRLMAVLFLCGATFLYLTVGRRSVSRSHSS